MRKYVLTDEQKKQYASSIILREMIQEKRYFPIVFEGNQTYLEPLFEYMLGKKTVRIESIGGKKYYVPTEKGREILQNFLDKYSDYLNTYDLYCAVDTKAGEFAFSSWYDMEEEEWNKYLDDEKWEDLRVAVCAYKNQNAKKGKTIPVTEVVFMLFVFEGRFDLEKEGWEFDLVNDLMWNEILEICETNDILDQINIPGEEDIMTNIIEAGTQLRLDLMAKQKEIDEAENSEEDDGDEFEEEEIVTYVETVEETYYDDGLYLDPFFIAPCWYYDPWYY